MRAPLITAGLIAFALLCAGVSFYAQRALVNSLIDQHDAHVTYEEIDGRCVIGCKLDALALTGGVICTDGGFPLHEIPCSPPPMPRHKPPYP